MICVLKTMNLIKIFLLGDSGHTFWQHRNFKLRPCKASHDYLPIKVAHAPLANICPLWILLDNYAWNICWHLLLQKYVQWVSGGWVGSTHQQFHCGNGSKLGPNTQTQLAHLSNIEHSMFLIDHFEGYVSPLLTLRCTIFVDLWELGEPAAPWGVWGYESSVATDIMVRCKRSGNDLTDLSPLVNTDGLTNFWGAKGTKSLGVFSNYSIIQISVYTYTYIVHLSSANTGFITNQQYGCNQH